MSAVFDTVLTEKDNMDIDLNDTTIGTPRSLYTKNNSNHANRNANNNPLMNFTSSVVMTSSTTPSVIPEKVTMNNTYCYNKQTTEQNTLIPKNNDTDKHDSPDAIKSTILPLHQNNKKPTSNQQVLPYKCAPKTIHQNTTSHQIIEETYSQQIFNPKVNNIISYISLCKRWP